MREDRIICKICGMGSLGKSGLGEYLFMETTGQFEKHMEIYHPKEFKEVQGEKHE